MALGGYGSCPNAAPDAVEDLLMTLEAGSPYEKFCAWFCPVDDHVTLQPGEAWVEGNLPRPTASPY